MPKFFEFSTSYELCSLNRTLFEHACTLTINSQSCERHLVAQKLTDVPNYNLCMNFTSVTDITDATQAYNENAISSYRYSAPASKMRLNSFYVQFYATNLTFLINGVIPFTVIIILNILILKELIKIQNPRQVKGI